MCIRDRFIAPAFALGHFLLNVHKPLHSEMCIRDSYDILARQEYLGHTRTAKTHKVSYKSKKTRKNEEAVSYTHLDVYKRQVDFSALLFGKKN